MTSTCASGLVKSNQTREPRNLMGRNYPNNIIDTLDEGNLPSDCGFILVHSRISFENRFGQKARPLSTSKALQKQGPLGQIDRAVLDSRVAPKPPCGTATISKSHKTSKEKPSPDGKATRSNRTKGAVQTLPRSFFCKDFQRGPSPAVRCPRRNALGDAKANAV